MNRRRINKCVSLVQNIADLGVAGTEKLLITVPPTTDKEGKVIPGSQYWDKRNKPTNSLKALYTKSKVLVNGNTEDPDKELENGKLTAYQKKANQLERLTRDLKRHGLSIPAS